MAPIVIEGINGSAFNFTSAYVTAVQNKHYITTTGYSGSNPTSVYSRTDWLLCTNKLFLFNFVNVTKVVIDPASPDGSTSTFNNIVLDNVTISTGLGGLRLSIQMPMACPMPATLFRTRVMSGLP